MVAKLLAEKSTDVVEANRQLNEQRALFLIAFLFQSMKFSYENKGIGAECILPLFKDLLLRCKPLLVVGAGLAPALNDAALLEIVMRQVYTHTHRENTYTYTYIHTHTHECT